MLELMIYSCQGAPQTSSFICYFTDELFLLQIFSWWVLFLELWCQCCQMCAVSWWLRLQRVNGVWASKRRIWAHLELTLKLTMNSFWGHSVSSLWAVSFSWVCNSHCELAVSYSWDHIMISQWCLTVRYSGELSVSMVLAHTFTGLSALW